MIMKARTQLQRLALASCGLRLSVGAGRFAKPAYRGSSRNPAIHAWRAWEGCGVT